MTLSVLSHRYFFVCSFVHAQRHSRTYLWRDNYPTTNSIPMVVLLSPYHHINQYLVNMSSHIYPILHCDWLVMYLFSPHNTSWLVSFPPLFTIVTYFNLPSLTFQVHSPFFLHATKACQLIATGALHTTNLWFNPICQNQLPKEEYSKKAELFAWGSFQ